MRLLHAQPQLYMKTDELLLVDIYENFENQYLTTYALDLSHYYTTLLY